MSTVRTMKTVKTGTMVNSVKMGVAAAAPETGKGKESEWR